MNNERMFILQDVKHIPNIYLNLISTNKLDDKGYHNGFNDGQLNLIWGDMVVALVIRLGRA